MTAAAARSGNWEQYEYGRAPRTYVVEETLALSAAPTVASVRPLFMTLVRR